MKPPHLNPNLLLALKCEIKTNCSQRLWNVQWLFLWWRCPQPNNITAPLTVHSSCHLHSWGCNFKNVTAPVKAGLLIAVPEDGFRSLWQTLYPFPIPYFLPSLSKRLFSLLVSALPELYGMAGEETTAWGLSTSKKPLWFWIEMGYAHLHLSLHKLLDFGSVSKKQAVATFPTSHRIIELLRLERLVGSPSPVINPCLWLLLDDVTQCDTCPLLRIGDPTTSLGRLFEYHATLSGKAFFLISNLKSSKLGLKHLHADWSILGLQLSLAEPLQLAHKSQFSAHILLTCTGCVSVNYHITVHCEHDCVRCSCLCIWVLAGETSQQ